MRNISSRTIMDIVSDYGRDEETNFVLNQLVLQNRHHYLLYLDSFGFSNNHFEALWQLSDRNYEKLIRTLLMFNCGIFEDEEILHNLEQENPVDFIDDSFEYLDRPDYSTKFDYNHPNWFHYCNFQRDIFENKDIKQKVLRKTS